MTESLDTYCPSGDAEVSACLCVRPATLAVRGEDVEFDQTVAACPVCGSVIGDTRVESANLERAYAVYRQRHGIMTPGAIKDLRLSYGLSLREFSKFLGFGEQTEYRYEHGDLPDQSHSVTIKSALSYDGAKYLLAQNGGKLTDKSVSKIKRRLEAMTAGSRGRAITYVPIEELEADAPSSANGYRKLDLDRVAALVFILSGKCPRLFWTKLQKALFFADMVSYERSSRSLTGLAYAHATYGPVMDKKEEVRSFLARRGTVEFAEEDGGYGEVLVPKAQNGTPFTDAELALIDEVAAFVNTFDRAKDLSDFSHQLACWANTPTGRVIEYTLDDGQVGRAMAKRMASYGTR